MVCSSTDVFSCFTCSLFTDSLNLTQTPGGYFGPCTVRPNVIFIFCTGVSHGFGIGVKKKNEQKRMKWYSKKKQYLVFKQEVQKQLL